MLSLRENFHAIVGASTEAQDGARSSNLVTDCLLSKKFFEKDFSLRGIESGCRCGKVDIRKQKDGHVFDDKLRHGADAEKAEFF